MNVNQIRSTSLRESFVGAVQFTDSVLGRFDTSIEAIANLTYGEIFDGAISVAEKAGAEIRSFAIALWDLICTLALVLEWIFQDYSLEPGEEKLEVRLNRVVSFYWIRHSDRIQNWKSAAGQRLARIYSSAMKH